MNRSILAHHHLDEDVLARLRHVNLRLEQLYGLRLNAQEFMTLCRNITRRCVPFQVLRSDYQDRQILQLTLKGKVVVLVYSLTREIIHTALHPKRGLQPKRQPRLQPRQGTRRHAYAQRRAGGGFKHGECALAFVQVSRPVGAHGNRRRNV